MSKKAPGEKLLALTPVPDDAESGKLLPAWQGKIASLKISGIIHCHLVCWLAHLDLGAHLLNLLCLLFESRGEGLYFFLLARPRSLGSYSLAVVADSCS